MAPVLGDGSLAVGASPALKAYLGGFAVWEPPGGLVLPEIGEEFEGGYYAGLIDENQAGIGTHALIVAPASGGQTTGIAYKTTDTNTAINPSFTNGAANTAALRAISTAIFPAANFCVAVTAGGFNDWYLPASKELEIAYYNLKPATTANVTGSAFPTWSENNVYAVPSRSSIYTPTDPARTSALAFRTGGAQAFAAIYYWSSSLTAFNNSTAWRKRFVGGERETFNTLNSTSSVGTRAFRRVAL